MLVSAVLATPAWGDASDAVDDGPPLVELLPRFGEIYERLQSAEYPLATPVTRVPALWSALESLQAGDVDPARAMVEQLAAELGRRTAGGLLVEQATFVAPSTEVLGSGWPSALSQGLALALADELYRVTGSPAARVLADRLADGFSVPLTSGGFARWSEDGVFFATYPGSEVSFQLDGALIATYALHRYASRSQRPEIRSLVRSAASWFERNLGRFDVTAATGSFSAPASALGRAGTSLTFRFVGPGDATIAAMELDVGRRSIRADLERVDAGPDGPGFALLVDADHHNWTGPLVEADRTMRGVRAGQGSDDVAPFVVSLPLRDDPAEPRVLRVESDDVTGLVAVEVLIGVTYRHLLDLPAGGPHVSEVDLPTVTEEIALFVDPTSTVAIAELALQLGREWGATRMTALGTRWLGAYPFVPGGLDPRALPSRELGLDAPPVIASDPAQGVLHVEYPAVVATWTHLDMLYSRYTTGDGLWRLAGARSRDGGRTWDDAGGVVDGSLFGAGSVAFPDVIDVPGHGVLVAFSADVDRSPGYDAVMVATGRDVWSLGTPDVAVRAPGLDPVLWVERGVVHLAFVVALPDGTSRIDHAVLIDGTWSLAPPLLRSSAQAVYTQSTFGWQGVRYWALNVSSGRQSVRLYCRSLHDDELLEVPDSEFGVVDASWTGWNQYRYGYEIVDVGGPQPVAFYNGIRLDEGDGSGAIGRATLDLAGLEVPRACRQDTADAFGHR